MNVKPENRFDVFIYCYGVITLLFQVLALSLTVYQMAAADRGGQPLEYLVRMKGIVSCVFVVLCIVFIIGAAILLLMGRIDLKGFLQMHSCFWVIQLLGVLAFRIIARSITPYALMVNVYEQFIVLFQKDVVAYLFWVPVLIRIGMNMVLRFTKKESAPKAGQQ